jgi:alanine-glyoxylate transaminase/serine-glyoxylate transaminase/serine-pyruvate transaminase
MAGSQVAGLLPPSPPARSCEIAGGLGLTAGQIWRVGLMGFNCKPQNVEVVLAALKDGLKQQGRL